MGAAVSHEEAKHFKTLAKKLSKFELSQIEDLFKELSSVTQEGTSVIKQPTWLNRDVFADKFGLPELLVEQMFEAFDRDKNGVIDSQEFMMGMSLCLHGSLKDKCRLLFKMFNLNDDEGVSPDELCTVLTSALESADLLLAGAVKQPTAGSVAGTSGGTVDSSLAPTRESQSEEALIVSVTVDQIVRDAFETCDVSRNGKLDLEEFEKWVHKNPKLVNNVFVIHCPKPASTKQEDKGDGQFNTTPYVNVEEDDIFLIEEDKLQEPPVTSDPLQEPPVTTKPEPISAPISMETKPTLLQLATNSPKLKRASDLFAPAVTVESGTATTTTTRTAAADGASFFDNIGSEVLPVAGGMPEGGKFHEIRSTSSEHYASLESIPSLSNREIGQSRVSQLLGGSDSHLDQLSVQQATGTLATSPSLRSIALSNDSLEEKDEQTTDDYSSAEASMAPAQTEPQLGITNDSYVADPVSTDMRGGDENGLVSTGEANDADEGWHPLQGRHDRSEASEFNGNLDMDRSSSMLCNSGSRSGSAEDVSSSFVNTSSFLDVGTEESGSFEEALNGRASSFVEAGVEAEEGENGTDDPTTAYLSELSRGDPVKVRRCSFWQPSVKALQALKVVESGREVERGALTFPSVLVDGVMGDPIKELVSKYLGEQEASKRASVTVDTVEFSDAGLRQLLKCGCWRAGVEFTTKFLSAHGQGVITSEDRKVHTTHTPKLLQTWFVRIALLVKLRMFSKAEAELEAFADLDAADLRYEFYPSIYGERRGSMVPFSLRILYAELPQHNGRNDVTLDRLYVLLHKVEAVQKNLIEHGTESGALHDTTCDSVEESKAFWRARHLRVMYSIGNCFLGMEEYALAITIFEKIIKLVPDRKAAILSGIGRICLQFGDINSARRTFKRVDEIALGEPKTLSMVMMNKGFLALAQGNYSESLTQFQSAIKLNPENLSAGNNAAVCLLFLGKVKEACTTLENMVFRSPDSALSEDVLFNLCTVYELETSRALQKKHKLLDLVSRHRGDGFNVQCLKLS